MRGKKRRLGERKVGILAGINLFGGCSGEELAALADLFEEIERPAGCVIVREGEPGDAFYVIIDGTATATVGEQYVGSLSPGDFFGEMSLLERAPRAATITADSALELIVMSRRIFLSLIDDAPSFGMRMMRTMSERLRSVEAPATR